MRRKSRAKIYNSTIVALGDYVEMRIMLLDGQAFPSWGLGMPVDARMMMWV